MKDIKELISKIIGIKNPQEDKDFVVSTIKEVCGFIIDSKKIDFSKDSIKLNISSPERNTVFMNQAKILMILSEKLKDRQIKRFV
ncbi:MAG: hypothetical protein WCG97_00860 [bacterium]